MCPVDGGSVIWKEHTEDKVRITGCWLAVMIPSEGISGLNPCGMQHFFISLNITAYVTNQKKKKDKIHNKIVASKKNT